MCVCLFSVLTHHLVSAVVVVVGLLACLAVYISFCGGGGMIVNTNKCRIGFNIISIIAVVELPFRRLDCHFFVMLKLKK